MRRWSRYTGQLALDGRTPEFFGPLSHLREGMLAFLEHPNRPGRLFDTTGAIILCYPKDAKVIEDAGHQPHVDTKPRAAFWRLFAEEVRQLAFEGLTGLPLSVVDPTAVVKDGAVVGGTPFKVIELDGSRTLSPYAGGVLIGPGATVGSHTCIDSGIYGEWTEIHAGAFLDNLVHVGHSTIVRSGAKVVAGAVLGGWSDIGENAWIGIGAMVRDHVTVGAGAVVGMGAVITKDVPPDATVIGNPARVR